MSVLIRNIGIPSCCSDCLLNYDQMSCVVTGTRWWSDTMMLLNFDPDKERLYDCPLVEYNEVEAFKTVLNKLKECEMLCGKYDGEHGNEHYMYGISTVMEVIANLAGDEEFEDMFLKNMIKSEEKKDGLQ